MLYHISLLDFASSWLDLVIYIVIVIYKLNANVFVESVFKHAQIPHIASVVPVHNSTHYFKIENSYCAIMGNIIFGPHNPVIFY